MISRSGAENQNLNRWQVREMTTPRIVIPADVMAAVTATNERKTAEAQKMIAESLTNGTATSRSQQFGLVIEHADDVTDEHIAVACGIFDDYMSDDEHIDWYALWHHLDYMHSLCVTPDSAAERKIQRAVREHRKAGE